MGATHLWEIVQPACQVRSLSQLTVSEGFEEDRNSRHTIVVGVDASIWLHQTQAVFHHARHSQAGENPKLRILFYKLNRLLDQCLDVVVVFDGNERPATKHQAPAEAEAELAFLNRMGIIDVVMTDDSDALIFGAVHVMWNLNIKKDKDNVTIYSAQSIKSTAGINLTQGGLLLIAIICGGDYDKAGLLGCGKVVAHGLAQTTLGDTLLEAGRDMSEAELVNFLVQWRKLLRVELLTNKHGFLKCQYPSVVNAIHPDFPDPSVVLKYTQPITSWSHGRPLPPFSTWFTHEPDLAQLGALAERSFSWPPDKIVEKFRKRIWAGVCLHRLLEEKSPLLALVDHVVHGIVTDGLPGLSAFRQICGVNSSSLTSTIPFYAIEILENNLLKKATSTLQNNTDVPMARKIAVKLPVSIVRRILPGLHWKKPLPPDLQLKEWELILKPMDPIINIKNTADVPDTPYPCLITDHVGRMADDADDLHATSSSSHKLPPPVALQENMTGNLGLSHSRGRLISDFLHLTNDYTDFNLTGSDNLLFDLTDTVLDLTNDLTDSDTRPAPITSGRLFTDEVIDLTIDD
ncbi:uncharacterized protein LACBIDRAFT_306505 [Laccaria bicolor S238N-H82]|uniref:Predicted protein n=1 Tax=Laccaria bicolor (strain S238N-H82 / ATCC MYA-4686) TaxID=486041 RepID=B0DN74_LACBS|nr:uncharacterized protein LACBIDRAFT_306505 [Laccaria bicolor S238N-H82]EDR03823.1 predicted protein [Laccaria bicolor S238N-H82]|eukprot:XP_001885391.1 predicted protein [Laccaria bicolor S238N-H82]